MSVRSIHDSIGEIALLLAAADQTILRSFDLTSAGFAILGMLADSPNLRQVDLAVQLHLDSSTITRSIDRLAKAGLVQRVIAPDDRRAMLVQLLPAGRERLHHARQALDSSITQRIGMLNACEQQHLHDLLGKLRHSLRAYRMRS